MVPDLIAEALREELHPRREQLAAILSEARLIQGWLPQAPSPQLGARLEGRQNELALSLLALLTDWETRGGKVSLESNLLAKPVTVVVPQPPAERARAVEPSSPPVSRVDDRSSTLPRFEDRKRDTEVEIASSESVSRLAEHFRNGGLLREPPSTDWGAELAGVLAQMPLGAEDEVELDRCYRAIRDCDRWRLFPKDLQRALIGLMASRLRRLQDERGVNALRIEESFSRLSAFSKREQPGYVIGLSRHHRPMRDSWDEDSEAYWDRLAACLPEESASDVRPTLEKTLGELESLSAEISGAPSPEIGEAVAAQLRRTLRDALKGGVSSRDPRLVRVVAPHQDLLDSPGLPLAPSGDPKCVGRRGTNPRRGHSRSS